MKRLQERHILKILRLVVSELERSVRPRPGRSFALSQGRMLIGKLEKRKRQPR